MGLVNYDNYITDEGPDYCDDCGGVLTLDGVCRRCANEERDADRDNDADFDEPEEGEEF